MRWKIVGGFLCLSVYCLIAGYDGMAGIFGGCMIAALVLFAVRA